MLFTRAELEAAAETVYAAMRPTPQYAWPLLARRIGATVWVKHENHTPTGAFKLRGGLVHLDRLKRERPQLRGIVSATRGNHGQSLAFAGRRLGVPVTVLVPRGNAREKNAAMRAWGAELIEHGRDFDEAREHCEAICQREGMRYIHSANEPDLIAGVGTWALEVFDELPEPDVLLVPVGLGSGICGTSLVAAARSPATRVIGVQAEGAPSVTLSWRAGGPVETPEVRTFAEGMATRAGFELPQAILWDLLDDFVLVRDAEMRAAIRLLVRHAHTLAEGAGAAPLAAALRLKEQLAGRNVALVVSGGNLSTAQLQSIIGEGTP